MAFSLPTLLRAAFGQPPKLTCSRRVWDEGVQELHRRTGGHRESGAFLVGENRERTRIVRRFLYYDDFDPSCFANGIVEFDGRHFRGGVAGLQVFELDRDRGCPRTSRWIWSE